MPFTLYNCIDVNHIREPVAEPETLIFTGHSCFANYEAVCYFFAGYLSFIKRLFQLRFRVTGDRAAALSTRADR